MPKVRVGQVPWSRSIRTRGSDLAAQVAVSGVFGLIGEGVAGMHIRRLLPEAPGEHD